MRRKVMILSVLFFCMMFTVPAFAQEQESVELTPMEKEEILKDIEPVEIDKGIYIKDNGSVSIIYVDVSLAEMEMVSDNHAQVLNTQRTSAWDLSTPYLGSFQAASLVRTSFSFVGNSYFYVDFYDVSCPSDSQWKMGLYVGWDQILTTSWLDSSTTSHTVKYINLDTNKYYTPFFEKTDNGSVASGHVKVYL